MGKKRTMTIGSEEEHMQKEEAAKRREAKKRAKASEKEEVTPADTVEAASEEKPMKKEETKKSPSSHRMSPRHSANTTLVQENQYQLSRALDTLLQFQTAHFDETVELHLNTLDKVTGSVVLPHGTGKSIRVAILAPLQDAQAAQKLLDDIDGGRIDFDLLIATPDAMPRLAKAAKILGPRGLMPNPKNGTVTPHPEEAAKKFAGGQVNYKTEAKANIIHVSVGKMSFGKDKLTENITAMISSLEKGKVKSIYLKSTMSPSLRIG